jgi:hypothetical protein
MGPAMRMSIPPPLVPNCNTFAIVASVIVLIAILSRWDVVQLRQYEALDENGYEEANADTVEVQSCRLWDGHSFKHDDFKGAAIWPVADVTALY